MDLVNHFFFIGGAFVFASGVTNRINDALLTFMGLVTMWIGFNY